MKTPKADAKPQAPTAAKPGPTTAKPEPRPAAKPEPRRTDRTPEPRRADRTPEPRRTDRTPEPRPRKKKRTAPERPAVAPERLQQLQSLFKPRERREPRPRKRAKAPRAYHNLSEREVQEMVLARYGSLTDFSRVARTVREVAERHRRPQMTVQYALQKWRERGRHEDRRRHNGAHVQFKVDRAGLRELLLQPATLRQWSGFTLAERCQILRQHFQVDISLWSLRYFYAKHGVRNLSTNFAYRQSLAADPADVRAFAVRLAELVRRGEPLVYFDESSFHMWLRRSRTWMLPEHPVPLVLNQLRGENVTVYGAIGACLPGALFEQAAATNEACVLAFLTRLRAHANRRLDARTTLHLVLDNHSAHHTQRVQARLAQLQIEPHFMPPYSPQFNSIEALWACVKRAFKQRVNAQAGVVQQLEFQAILQEVLDAVTPEQQAAAARENNRDFLFQLLGALAQPPPAAPALFVPMPLPVLRRPFDPARMLAPEPSICADDPDASAPSLGPVPKLPVYLQTRLEDSWAQALFPE
jgi:transposase